MIETITKLNGFIGNEVALEDYERLTEDTTGASDFVVVTQLFNGVSFSEKKPNINIDIIQEGYVKISKEDQIALDLTTDFLYCKRHKVYTLYKQGEKRMNVLFNGELFPLVDKLPSLGTAVDSTYDVVLQNLMRLQELKATLKGIDATIPKDDIQYPSEEITAKYGVKKGIYNAPYIKVSERVSTPPKVKEAKPPFFQIKGFSTLPSYNAVMKKVDAGKKLNKYEEMIHKASKVGYSENVRNAIAKDVAEANTYYTISYINLYLLTKGKFQPSYTDANGNILVAK